MGNGIFMINSACLALRLFFLQARCAPVRTSGVMSSSFALLYVQDSERHFHMHQMTRRSRRKDTRIKII
uniref:Secreted protein n=1 Tax=Arundo donax TaxID=35708 RepID=A0A0A9A7B9_ARUDO